MLRNTLLLFLLSITSITIAQPLQTVRGTVIDKNSNTPISYASVVVLNTIPLLGTTTDSLGNFNIAKVPVGRYDIKVSSIGYENYILPEVLVISAKQTVLNIQLLQTSNALAEVTVTPAVNKEQPLNHMATVSARMLSVDEAKRYAGGFDDPARLASAFAGVGANSGVNGIIVRGNAPKFLQWKMEGIEIPNPNHFGELKAFGGGILTGLSSQMLANSDFFTGAFPAEYNNALSGVFDIKMRKGNNQTREHTISIGLIGVETSSEGPFLKGKKSSYLFNYRNSTLALLEPLLPENANSIKYQDLSFKLHFPTKRAGTFSVWGIGLTDGASANPKTDSTKWFYEDDKQKDRIKFSMGAAGITHRYFFNPTLYLNTTLATTSQSTDWESQILNSQLVLNPFSRITYTNQNLVLSSYVNKKFGTKHTNKTGIVLTQMRYDMNLKQSITSTLQTIVNTKGSSELLTAFSSSAIQLNSSWVLHAGINAQLFTLNNQYTIEPRLGLKKQLNRKSNIALAYGAHSRLELLNYYFNNSLATGEIAVNKKLDFTKAHHFVVSYQHQLANYINLKIEPYFQYLYNVPVVAGTSFSFINLQTDWFFAQKLQNTGLGQNLGIDLTLEKYLSKGYYYLVTASVFDSKYKGGDGIWRNSRFNRNIIANFLIGKEWQVGKNKQNLVGVNVRFSYQGGNRYSPVDVNTTMQLKEVVYDETKAFSKQANATFATHFTISYKKNKPKSTREVALKVLNLNAQPDFYGYKYNYINHTIDKDLATVVLPNLSYKIEF